MKEFINDDYILVTNIKGEPAQILFNLFEAVNVPFQKHQDMFGIEVYVPKRDYIKAMNLIFNFNQKFKKQYKDETQGKIELCHPTTECSGHRLTNFQEDLAVTNSNRFAFIDNKATNKQEYQFNYPASKVPLFMSGSKHDIVRMFKLLKSFGFDVALGENVKVKTYSVLIAHTQYIDALTRLAAYNYKCANKLNWILPEGFESTKLDPKYSAEVFLRELGEVKQNFNEMGM